MHLLIVDDWGGALSIYDKQYFEALNTSLLFGRRSGNLFSPTFGSTDRGGIGKTWLLAYLKMLVEQQQLQRISLSITDFKRTTTLGSRKWIERQLQQIGITLPEEPCDADILPEVTCLDFLIMSQAVELAKQREGSAKIEVQREEGSFLPSVQEALQAYFYSVAIFVLERLTASLRRFVIALRRLQYLAAEIHNRVARSPSPFRREPPVGGIKVGGEWSPSSCLLVA